MLMSSPRWPQCSMHLGQAVLHDRHAEKEANMASLWVEAHQVLPVHVCRLHIQQRIEGVLAQTGRSLLPDLVVWLVDILYALVSCPPQEHAHCELLSIPHNSRVEVSGR